MDKHQTHPDVIKRLKRAEGHLKRVIQMTENHESCPDVAQQLHAVIQALIQSRKIIVQDHIEHCIQEGLTSQQLDIQSMFQELKEIAKYL